MKYLLDTNHLNAIVRDQFGLRVRLASASDRGHQFGSCVPVLSELHAGFGRHRNDAAHRQSLDQVLAQFRLWPATRRTAAEYGEIYRELRQIGRAMSQVDIILAAIVRTQRIILLTADQDFSAVKSVTAENWLA